MTPALWVNVKGFEVIGSRVYLQHEVVVVAGCLITLRVSHKAGGGTYISCRGDINSLGSLWVKHPAVMISLDMAGVSRYFPA